MFGVNLLLEDYTILKITYTTVYSVAITKFKNIHRELLVCRGETIWYWYNVSHGDLGSRHKQNVGITCQIYVSKVIKKIAKKCLFVYCYMQQPDRGTLAVQRLIPAETKNANYYFYHKLLSCITCHCSRVFVTIVYFMFVGGETN